MTRYFKKYSLHYRSLLAMGVPIMVGQLGVILTGFVDNIMVGHHTTAELSAASFVNNIFMLPLMFATGFAMGITPLIGEQTGRNELPQAGQIFRYGLFANGILAASLILIMGTLYFFLDRMGLPQELLPLMRPYYLLHLIGLVPVLLFNAFKQFADGTTDTLTPMFILLSSNLLNIIGNTVLIYGYAGFPEWGLFGAGVSTLTARIFTIVAGLCIFMYRKRYRRFKSGFFRLPSNRKLYRPILTMGIPVALQLGMETGSFSLSVIFIGWIGSTALAAHQAAVPVGKADLIASAVIPNLHVLRRVLPKSTAGIGAAVTILISNARGSNRDHEIRPIATAGIHIVLGLILVVTGIMFFARQHIGYIFTDSPDVAMLVSAIVIPMIVYQLGDGLQITLAGALRGLGVVKPMVWIAFISYFIVSLPASYCFAFLCRGGAPGVWWGYPVGLSCAALLFFWQFHQNSKPEKIRH